MSGSAPEIRPLAKEPKGFDRRPTTSEAGPTIRRPPPGRAVRRSETSRAREVKEEGELRILGTRRKG
jgi:hypothetical protein